jgi:hypothetical protein
MTMPPMKRAARRGAMAGVIVTLAAASAGARAQTPAAAERDKLATFLRAGFDAAQKKNFAACIDAYASALRIEASSTALGELGLCEEATGRNVDAYHHLAAALRSPGVDPKKEPGKRFGDGLATVSARVAQVFLAVDPPHASVVIDGRPRGKAEGRSVILEPGPHTFAARLEGYRDAIDPRQLEAGDAPTIHLILHPKPKPAPVAAAAPSLIPKLGVTEAPPSWFLPARSLRGVLVGLTYASAATALASGMTAYGLDEDRASMVNGIPPDACNPKNPKPPPASCGPVHERREQRNIALGVTVGAGIVGGVLLAATGAAMGLEARRAGNAKVSVVPSVDAHGGAVVVVGAW